MSLCGDPRRWASLQCRTATPKCKESIKLKNPLVRLTRYASAWLHFGQIRHLSLDNHSVEEVLDATLGYANGFFAPFQVREEILEALMVVRELRPRYIIEIGTAAGGTLLLWSRVAHPEATIVTIDLRGGEFGGGYSRSRALLLRHLGLPGQKIHLIRADSRDPATVDLAERLLHGNAVDFLFIDADHTEAGVRTDYKLYSPLMRSGGVIAFHDIAIDWPGYGVKKVWNEISSAHRTRTIVGSAQAYGIGLLYC